MPVIEIFFVFSQNFLNKCLKNMPVKPGTISLIYNTNRWHSNQFQPPFYLESDHKTDATVHYEFESITSDFWRSFLFINIKPQKCANSRHGLGLTSFYQRCCTKNGFWANMFLFFFPSTFNLSS